MITATLYQRPFGHRSEIDISDILPEDEKYLVDNNIEVSMEDMPLDRVALYGKYGTGTDGDSKEAIVIVKFSDPCRDGMAKLVQAIKELKGEEACPS